MDAPRFWIYSYLHLIGLKWRMPKSGQNLVAIIAVVVSVWALPVRAVVIPADQGRVVSLDGTWRFKLEQGSIGPEPKSGFAPLHAPVLPNHPEAFQTLDYHEDANWHDLAVPGNWEMAGYSPATYGQPDDAIGLYRLWFDVPASWKGQQVHLNFDGVQNGAELFLNGQPVPVDEPSWGRANYHEGGFDAFQADLTSVIRFGQKNLLAIRVTKNTKSVDMDTGDYFFLGGIHRSVTLFAVPQDHLDDLTVRTTLLPGGSAQVRVVATLAGTSPGMGISARLGDLSPVTVKADAQGNLTAVIDVDRPRLWSAEHPNLYSLTVDVIDASGKSIEKVERRVGIREVAIRNGVLLINGVPVKLAGICRHDLYPTLGSALNADAWRKDLLLMKAANINAVRTSHYPDGSGFYDLCDELGIYVLDEMAACWVDTKSDALTPAFRQHADELVRRDKNHPSVIIWGIGNENPPGKNDQVAADEIRRLDPTRPRLVSIRAAAEYGVEFSDNHYPGMRVIDKDLASALRQSIPQIYTENPNVWDVRNGADAGSLDLWGAVLDREWRKFWPDDHFAGSFLWEWADRAVADQSPVKLYDYDPVTGINLVKVKGIVDAFRNPRPDYYQLKVVYAPIKIDLTPVVSGSTVKVHAINRYSFTDLAELDTGWHLLKDGHELAIGTVHLTLAPRTAGDLAFDLPAGALAGADTLRLDFDHPDGGNVVTYQLRLTPGPAPTIKVDDTSAGIAFPRLNLIAVSWGADHTGWRRAFRHPGKLINISAQLANHPSGVAISEAALDSTPLDDVNSIEADVVLADDATSKVLAHIQATHVDGRFSYNVSWTGATTDIQELGWAFAGSKATDHFSWRREAYWSYYPDDYIGRAEGTATPDSADVHVTKFARPDAFDFISTKYHCDWATLATAGGDGIGVLCDPKDRQQCKAGTAPGGGYELIVNAQVSPPRDISSGIVADFYLKPKKGDHVSAAFKVGHIDRTALGLR